MKILYHITIQSLFITIYDIYHILHISTSYILYVPFSCDVQIPIILSCKGYPFLGWNGTY